MIVWDPAVAAIVFIPTKARSPQPLRSQHQAGSLQFAVPCSLQFPER
jgi:hypothetical protein